MYVNQNGRCRSTTEVLQTSQKMNHDGCHGPNALPGVAIGDSHAAFQGETVAESEALVETITNKVVIPFTQGIQGGNQHSQAQDESEAITFCGVEACIDVVDFSTKTHCGYNFILHIVDPKARYGHATAMKSNTEPDCIAAIHSLLSIARVKPSTIFYDHRTSFVLKLGEKYPFINFFYLTQSDDMINYQNKYLELIH
jgi:hypothetical protein